MWFVDCSCFAMGCMHHRVTWPNQENDSYMWWIDIHLYRHSPDKWVKHTTHSKTRPLLQWQLAKWAVVQSSHSSYGLRFLPRIRSTSQLSLTTSLQYAQNNVCVLHNLRIWAISRLRCAFSELHTIVAWSRDCAIDLHYLETVQQYCAISYPDVYQSRTHHQYFVPGEPLRIVSYSISVPIVAMLRGLLY